jgi:Ca2+:H+ antiporter
MLLFAVIGLCVPALFTHSMNSELLTTKYEGLSVTIAIVMFVLYILNLVFSFYTHKDLMAVEEDKEEIIPEWSLRKSILVLIIVTVFIAIESELLVNGIEPLTKSLGLSEFFVGMIIIPIVGNVAEHTTGVIMAMKNKMDISLEIAIGSSLQIILFVAPVLIFISQLFSPMSIVFNEFELAALVVSVLIANRIAHDGKSNWLEGVQLLGVYFIIAASFFII